MEENAICIIDLRGMDAPVQPFRECLKIVVFNLGFLSLGGN